VTDGGWRYSRAGLTFDVRVDGPDDGVPVLLLHGFPQDSSCWQTMSPLLHAAGLRTFAPDQRGYSPDARPAGRRAYRVGECVADVVALLDAAGISSAHVVGHDWGGGIAWLLALTQPQRVASLTVLSTPHPRAMLREMLGPQVFRSAYMGFFQLPFLPEAVLHRGMHRWLTSIDLPAPDAARYAARMSGPGALTAALNWYRAMPLSVLPGGLPDRLPGRLPGPCRVPTTYLWGRRDPALGRSAAEGTQAHVRADYQFIELDAGHWLPETRPTQAARAVIQRAGRQPAD
jgi:pimeloyl-ACP methyl ester carboxylesterase